MWAAHSVASPSDTSDTHLAVLPVCRSPLVPSQSPAVCVATCTCGPRGQNHSCCACSTSTRILAPRAGAKLHIVRLQLPSFSERYTGHDGRFTTIIEEYTWMRCLILSRFNLGLVSGWFRLSRRGLVFDVSGIGNGGVVRVPTGVQCTLFSGETGDEGCHLPVTAWIMAQLIACCMTGLMVERAFVSLSAKMQKTAAGFSRSMSSPE